MMKMLMTLTGSLLSAGFAFAQPGFLQVNGQAGRFQLFQKVKAVRCDTQQRGACDAPLFLDLNRAQSVPEGSYIVGFENSLYPGWVQVSGGTTTTLNLERLDVPANVKGQKIKVYRDFSSLLEQKKIYFSMYNMGRHFFRLDKNNFNDLYLTGAWERDFVQRFTYETCGRIDSYGGDVPFRAKAVCAATTKAKSYMSLVDLYEFANDGTFREMWVTFPGDVIPTKHPRYLVSAPLQEGDFVAVFPGVYRFIGESKGQGSVQVKTANIQESFVTSKFSLESAQNYVAAIVAPSDCSAAKMWKTDQRAYCVSDSLEGCDRSQALTCEEM